MPTARKFSLFDTPIGRCGVAWGDRGIVGVQLPESGDAATRARLKARFDAESASPSPAVEAAIDEIQRLLRGEPRALDAVLLDMDGVPPFHRRVYELARKIPPGETSSYGDIAARAGSPGSARAVGQALGKNPFAIVVPCHRVVAAGGRIGGFSANGGLATKMRMLNIEGARHGKQETLFEGDGAFGFDVDVAVAHLRRSDPVLRRAMDDVGPFAMQLKRTPSLFGALVEAIVYQQLTGRAAATIHSRVCALFPRAHRGPSAEQILRASEEQLRGAGLSRAKTLSLKDLAAKARAKHIPTLAEAHRMKDEELIERLTAVRGIGQWTVEMLLMFRLGRADVLPIDDYGVRKGFGVLFDRGELPGKKDVAAYGERWKPYRTVASWYLWRMAERSKTTATPPTATGRPKTAKPPAAPRRKKASKRPQDAKRVGPSNHRNATSASRH
ncbi:MAG TPA: methylated-DNA--[protein]-cysteine S-methyltransferase [Polyangiaceae bacterium]|jgi:methylated-DNA-[protein]-cysteine S-methyltransferase|nr:methylated-DNA--[protein]-cysteine S-methyltransferase [Polyangiaceae bacterium]